MAVARVGAGGAMPQAVELEVLVMETRRRQLAPSLLTRKIVALRDWAGTG